MSELSESLKKQLLRQTTKTTSAIGLNHLETWIDLWNELQQMERIQAAESAADLVWYPKALTILNDLQNPKSSKLAEFVLENADGLTVLVQDSIYSGGHSLFFIKRVYSWEDTAQWYSIARPEIMRLRVFGMSPELTLAIINLDCLVAV